MAQNQHQVQGGCSSRVIALPEITVMRIATAEGPGLVLPSCTGKEKPISRKFPSCGQLKRDAKSLPALGVWLQWVKGGLTSSCMSELGSRSLCQNTSPSVEKNPKPTDFWRISAILVLSPPYQSLWWFLWPICGAERCELLCKASKSHCCAKRGGGDVKD